MVDYTAEEQVKAAPPVIAAEMHFIVVAAVVCVLFGVLVEAFRPLAQETCNG
jgi:hypothetical protein